MSLESPDPSLASPDNRNPENLRLQTYLITLSPKEDVTQDTIDQIVTYAKKKCLYAFVVVEYGTNGKKHLHACVVTQLPQQRRNIQDYWAAKMVKQYPGSIGRYACKVTNQYDHKWYDEYLRKGGEIVFDKYDRDLVTNYFPSKEQQQQLIECKRGADSVRVHIAFELVDDWKEKDPSDSSYESAIRYLHHCMFIDRKPPIYIDDRKKQDMAWFMYRCRNDIMDPSADDKNYAARKTGNSFFQS